MKSVKVLLSLLFVLLTGCGGGGGGGGGESAAGNDSSGLRVLHGALDIPPLTVNTGGESTYNVSFRGDAPYRSLPGESSSVALHRANIPTAVLFQLPVVSDGKTKQTLLVYGLEGDGSLSATVTEDNFPQLSDGMSAIRLAHGLHRTGAITLTAGSEGSEAVSAGKSGSFVMVPAGQLPYTLTEAGDAGPFLSGNFEFEDKKYYTLFVTGEQGVFFTHRIYVDN